MAHCASFNFKAAAADFMLSLSLLVPPSEPRPNPPPPPSVPRQLLNSASPVRVRPPPL